MSKSYISKKIIIVGYMASGKSTISNLLALNLGKKTIDLDMLIEKKAQKTISEIFKTQSELYFRQIENDCFNQLVSSKEELIISTGGGTVCYYNNHLSLQYDYAESIYLKYKPQTLVERLKKEKSSRPIIQNLNDQELLEFVSKHLFERSYYYNMAKHVINCDGKSIKEIVEECLLLLNGLT